MTTLTVTELFLVKFLLFQLVTLVLSLDSTEQGSFSPFHQMFIPVDKIPLSLLFSRLNSPISLMIPSCIRSFSLLIIPFAVFWPPGCPSVQAVEIFLTKVQQRKNLLPVGNDLPYAAQEAIAHLCHEAALHKISLNCENKSKVSASVFLIGLFPFSNFIIYD